MNMIGSLAVTIVRGQKHRSVILNIFRDGDDEFALLASGWIVNLHRIVLLQ